MRPTFRLQHCHVQSWMVDIIPKRPDSLPYSKIKTLCQRFRQRLVASRTAPVGSDVLPPVTVFNCALLSPSYVMSQKLADQLPESVISSLSSKLGVYDDVYTLAEDHGFGNQAFHVKERDYNPEVFTDEALQGSGDEVRYYGPGQIHVVGMLDVSRTEPNIDPRMFSALGLQRRLVSSLFNPFGLQNWGIAATSLGDETSSWILVRTDQGMRKIAHVHTYEYPIEDVATASVTLNYSVPMQGVDPDRTCPHVRLSALADQAGIEYDPFTSYRAHEGGRAAEQAGYSHTLSYESICRSQALSAVQHALGAGSQRYVDHSLALGASDPDLESDGMVEEEYHEIAPPWSWD